MAEISTSTNTETLNTEAVSRKAILGIVGPYVPSFDPTSESHKIFNNPHSPLGKAECVFQKKAGESKASVTLLSTPNDQRTRTDYFEITSSGKVVHESCGYSSQGLTRDCPGAQNGQMLPLGEDASPERKLLGLLQNFCGDPVVF